jgi:hypothetical protein
MVKSRLTANPLQAPAMKHTLYRILLAALVADIVGTIIILLFAAAFSGGANDDSVLGYAGLTAFIMGVGAALALPAAALGVLLGDLIAPNAGVGRIVAFAALGAGLGAFIGTPVVGGLSGVAGGIVGSLGKQNSLGAMEREERAGWIRRPHVAVPLLLSIVIYLAATLIFRGSLLD